MSGWIGEPRSTFIIAYCIAVVCDSITIFFSWPVSVPMNTTVKLDVAVTATDVIRSSDSITASEATACSPPSGELTSSPQKSSPIVWSFVAMHGMFCEIRSRAKLRDDTAGISLRYGELPVNVTATYRTLFSADASAGPGAMNATVLAFAVFATTASSTSCSTMLMLCRLRMWQMPWNSDPHTIRFFAPLSISSILLTLSIGVLTAPPGHSRTVHWYESFCGPVVTTVWMLSSAVIWYSLFTAPTYTVPVLRSTASRLLRSVALLLLLVPPFAGAAASGTGHSNASTSSTIPDAVVILVVLMMEVDVLVVVMVLLLRRWNRSIAERSLWRIRSELPGGAKPSSLVLLPLLPLRLLALFAVFRLEPHTIWHTDPGFAWASASRTNCTTHHNNLSSRSANCGSDDGDDGNDGACWVFWAPESPGCALFRSLGKIELLSPFRPCLSRAATTSVWCLAHV
uniref:Uncharacterized protein n=1 Tax=Anopheles farauti TaxID=69004 RepID=A0A182QVY1_9DIPT